MIDTVCIQNISNLERTNPNDGYFTHRLPRKEGNQREIHAPPGRGSCGRFEVSKKTKSGVLNADKASIEFGLYLGQSGRWCLEVKDLHHGESVRVLIDPSDDWELTEFLKSLGFPRKSAERKQE